MNHDLFERFGAAVISQPATLPAAVLRDRPLLVARAVWVTVALLTVGLFVASVPAYYEQHKIVCAEGGACHYPQLSPESALALQEIGISVDFYAVYETILSVIFTGVWFAVAAVIFWRRSDERIALFVSLFLATFGGITFGYTANALVPAHPNWWLPVRFVYFLGVVSFFLFFYLFPNGRFVPRWTRWLAIVAVVWVVPIAFFPNSAFDPENWPALLQYLVWLGFFGTMVFAQVYRYRHVSGPAERQQTKWVVFGVTTAIVAFAGLLLPFVLVPSLDEPGSLYDLVVDTPAALSMLLIPLSIGVAVLRYRLWDVDVIVNRTLVYGALTASVVGIYVLVVEALGTLLWTQGDLLVSLLATGLIAILFSPLRDRLQRGVNRLMYGERDDPYGVLSRLGRRLEATLAPGAALSTIVETVAQALKLPYAAIALKQDDGGFVTAAEYGIPISEPVVLPLAYQREPVGQLVLAPRAPGEAFSPSDRRLLEDLARQTGVAVHAVRLTADLQRSRERLVAAREEERRRLRRDLHDGLGPQLASLTMRAEAAHDLIPIDPVRAQGVLEGLTEQAQEAVADVRRLVYALRPPALDTLGLMGALRSQAAHHNQGGLRVAVDGPEELPALPAAVEVAAYRIALEALTNVVRHAKARNCTVCLTLDEENGVLSLEVADDGRGIGEDRRAGVGLTSMRERAEELGGSCTVEDIPSGGTRVRAFLPYVRDHVMGSEAGEPNLQEA